MTSTDVANRAATAAASGASATERFGTDKSPYDQIPTGGACGKLIVAAVKPELVPDPVPERDGSVTVDDGFVLDPVA